MAKVDLTFNSTDPKYTLTLDITRMHNIFVTTYLLCSTIEYQAFLITSDNKKSFGGNIKSRTVRSFAVLLLLEKNNTLRYNVIEYRR